MAQQFTIGRSEVGLPTYRIDNDFVDRDEFFTTMIGQSIISVIMTVVLSKVTGLGFWKSFGILWVANAFRSLPAFRARR